MNDHTHTTDATEAAIRAIEAAFHVIETAAETPAGEARVRAIIRGLTPAEKARLQHVAEILREHPDDAA